MCLVRFYCFFFGLYFVRRILEFLVLMVNRLRGYLVFFGYYYVIYFIVNGGGVVKLFY